MSARTVKKKTQQSLTKGKGIEKIIVWYIRQSSDVWTSRSQFLIWNMSHSFLDFFHINIIYRSIIQIPHIFLLQIPQNRPQSKQAYIFTIHNQFKLIRIYLCGYINDFFSVFDRANSALLKLHPPPGHRLTITVVVNSISADDHNPWPSAVMSSATDRPDIYKFSPIIAHRHRTHSHKK